ncbi:hypothetical protein [Stenotrophomonas maltophilia]|uniref:hypothetical protein n=1 Tax=Stenotrophomonas maltophilia TaxID=40324 RepID=UPI001C60A662|nr:hypothetical protein [Stenotrophomonas maltophilia]
MRRYPTACVKRARIFWVDLKGAIVDWTIVDWTIVDWAIVDWAIVDWVESTVSRLSRAARAFHRHVQSSRPTVDSTAMIG